MHSQVPDVVVTPTLWLWVIVLRVRRLWKDTLLWTQHAKSGVLKLLDSSWSMVLIPCKKILWVLIYWFVVISDDQSLHDTTPLQAACESGNADLVSLLIQHGANVNYTTSDGYPPLHAACRLNNAKIVSRLLRAGANVNTTIFPVSSPFLRTARFSFLNTTIKECSSALHISCIAPSDKGRPKVLKLLVESGADINAKNRVSVFRFFFAHIGMKDGNTPAHLGSLISPDAVLDLLNLGADPTLKNSVRYLLIPLFSHLQNPLEWGVCISHLLWQLSFHRSGPLDLGTWHQSESSESGRYERIVHLCSYFISPSRWIRLCIVR